MSKYIINTDTVYGFDIYKSMLLMGTNSMGEVIVQKFNLDELEELNGDYINEHYGSLQDEAYQKGFEDGKAQSEKGCEGCRYESRASGENPCVDCSKNFKNHWAAKQTDEIKVGDELEHTVSGYTSKAIFLEKIKDDEDWYKCLFWTGCGVTILTYPKRQFKRTGRHFDIDRILEEMKA